MFVRSLVITALCTATLWAESPDKWILLTPEPLIHELPDEYFVTLHDIEFSRDKKNGWAVGEKGVILATADSGVTWEAQTVAAAADLKVVTFFDSLHGWVLGSPRDYYTSTATLCRTVDGGDSWQTIEIPQCRYFNRIGFVTTQRGWITTTRGELFVTVDGGESWEVTRIDESHGWNSWTSCFVDSTHGWAANRNHFYSTIDGGGEWKKRNLGTYRFESLAFIDLTNGWAVGAGKVFKTADGGQTWEEKDISAPARPMSVWFGDEGHGYIKLATNAFLISIDGGSNWHFLHMPPIVPLGVDQIGPGKFVVAGNNGKIYRSFCDPAPVIPRQEVRSGEMFQIDLSPWLFSETASFELHNAPEKMKLEENKLLWTPVVDYFYTQRVNLQLTHDNGCVDSVVFAIETNIDKKEFVDPVDTKSPARADLQKRIAVTARGATLNVTAPAGITSIDIFDRSGRRVYTARSAPFPRVISIPTSRLSKGQFFMRLNGLNDAIIRTLTVLN